MRDQKSLSYSKTMKFGKTTDLPQMFFENIYFLNNVNLGFRLRLPEARAGWACEVEGRLPAVGCHSLSKVRRASRSGNISGQAG